MIGRARGALVLLGVPALLGAASVPATEAGRALCQVGDERIVEASGLVATGSPPGGLLITANDSGDEGRVFVLDPGTCETVGVSRWAEDPDDVEALAPGPGEERSRGVWVGDIGDNPGTRDSVRVGLVPVRPGERDVAPQWTDLRYPDGARDAETLLRHPGTGRLFVVSKRVLGGAVYAVPDRVAPAAVGELRRVGPAPPLVTDGAFWPDGRHLLLRNYDHADVLSWPTLERVARLPLPSQPGGEAIAVTPDGRVLVASEGRDQPVLEVSVPAEVRAALEAGAAPSGSAPSGSVPSGSVPSGSAPSGSVPGQQAGPAVDDGEGPVVWRGVLVGLAGCGLLALALARFLRAPGGGSRRG